MSRKVPLSQNEIQPTFKGFLERMKSKRDVQSSTPKSSNTNVKPGDLDTSMDFNNEKLKTNDKMSIISLNSSDDSMYYNVIKSTTKANDSNLKDNYAESSKGENSCRNVQKSQIRHSYLSDSEDDIVIKSTLSLNRKKKFLIVVKNKYQIKVYYL